VPSTLGKNIQEAAGILSSNNLGMRILAEREDAILPEGMVLDQIPKPGRKIRPNQHVFVQHNKFLPQRINLVMGFLKKHCKEGQYHLR